MCPPAVHALLVREAQAVALWTTAWRRRFVADILPRGTDVERHLSRTVSVREEPLVVRVLPLVDPWLAWVSPTCLLVSEKMREDAATYSTHALRAYPVQH